MSETVGKDATGCGHEVTFEIDVQNGILTGVGNTRPIGEQVAVKVRGDRSGVELSMHRQGVECPCPAPGCPNVVHHFFLLHADGRDGRDGRAG